MNRRQRIDLIINTISKMGAPSLCRRFRNDEFCILMLHGVTDSHEQSGIGNTEEISIHVDDLEEICQLLSKHYHVPSLDEVVDAMETKTSLPPRSVVLTFDDGYASDYELAFPLLKKYGLHGTIFASTDFVTNKASMWWDRMEYAVGHTEAARLSIIIGETHIDRDLGATNDKPTRKQLFLDLLPIIKGLPQEKVYHEVGRIEDALDCRLSDAENPPAIYRPMTWNQAREMHKSDHVTIGGHTHTHRIMGRCTLETARAELETSLQLLKEHLGLDRPLFSYTNGHIGDFTPETNEILKELGYRCALLTETGFNRVEDDPFLLRRFSTGNNARYVDVMASGTMRSVINVANVLRGRKAA
ncbi:MAG: polysaccharide deacetylase family protein [Planctomycetota bacterium]